MIYAKHDIIILNKRYDAESRSDVYVPTQISGVAVYGRRISSNSGSAHSEDESYVLRIPEGAAVQNGRVYVPEKTYDATKDADLPAYWTIHDDDLVIVCATAFTDVDTPVITTQSGTITYAQAEAAGATYGYQGTLIHVTGYADNTLRGSAATRHYRVVGA